MTGQTSAAQAAPQPGAALPCHAPAPGSRVAALCGPVLGPLHIATRPPTCLACRYAIASNRYRWACSAVDLARAMLDLATSTRDDAEDALAELEAAPGVPAHTQPGAGHLIGRAVADAQDDGPRPVTR